MALGEWRFIQDGEIALPGNTLVYVLGRYGDVFGPLPVEMLHPDVWAGNMLAASHDAVAVAVYADNWRSAFPLDEQAIEATLARYNQEPNQ